MTEDLLPTLPALRLVPTKPERPLRAVRPHTPASPWTDRATLEALLRDAADGDIAAFLAFYDATSHLVWRLESRRWRSERAAREATSRRFVAAWERAGEQATSGLSPRAWLLALTAPQDDEAA